MSLTGTKIFARVTEELLVSLDRRKQCRKQLDPDPFDGRVYSIDEFYRNSMQFFDRPGEFFRDFAGPGAPNLRGTGHHIARSRLNGLARLYMFDSPILTDYPENNNVPFKWFRGPQRQPSTILLFAPGWGRHSQNFEENMCARLVRHGIDAGLLTKPFHQQRTPAGARSGEYFISSNLFWTIANFRQFTAEIRLLVQYMRRHYDYVGLIGLSSGGFQAGLASDCEDVDFLFPVMTGSMLGSVTWHGRLTRGIRRLLEDRGISEADLNKVWSITDQAVLGRHCRARFRKQYISLFDRVVPTEYQMKLWEVYGKPDRCLLEASHYSFYFSRGGVIDDIAEYVRHCIA
jgi:Alpha/beta hydrolase domain containing 18